MPDTECLSYIVSHKPYPGKEGLLVQGTTCLRPRISRRPSQEASLLFPGPSISNGPLCPPGRRFSRLALLNKNTELSLVFFLICAFPQ